MKGIKQNDLKSCVACVCAMATGTTVEDFLGFCKGKEPPYNDYDVYRYLLSKKLVLGFGANIEYEPLERHDNLQVNYTPQGTPAYVVVKSERLEGEKHAIYWDGEQVYDPNPEVKDGRPLKEYKIDSWYPIHRVDE